MKIAYLLLVHQNPQLVARAIQQLSTPECGFFVHIDAKADLRQFQHLRYDHVHFTRRMPAFWGEFSLVEAAIILVRDALASDRSYDYLVLLSGSDYPLQSGAYIEEFFARHRGTEFMNLVTVPNKERNKPLSRLTTLHFPSSRPALKFLFRYLAKIGLATRDHRQYFGHLVPYAGSQWWALTREACEYVIDFHDRDSRLAKFYQNTFAADEGYLHTILGNSGFKTRMRRNLTFDEWLPGAAHPAMIKAEHVDRFEQKDVVLVQTESGAHEVLFARKFSDQNLELVHRIDRMIREKELARLVAQSARP